MELGHIPTHVVADRERERERERDIRRETEKERERKKEVDQSKQRELQAKGDCIVGSCSVDDRVVTNEREGISNQCVTRDSTQTG